MIGEGLVMIADRWQLRSAKDTVCKKHGQATCEQTQWTRSLMLHVMSSDFATLAQCPVLGSCVASAHSFACCTCCVMQHPMLLDAHTWVQGFCYPHVCWIIHLGHGV